MPNKIIVFNTKRFTLGECARFHARVTALIEEATPAVLHVEHLMPAYAQALSELQAVVNRQRAFLSTEEIREVDRLRDRAVGTITAVVYDYKSSPSNHKQDAASRLDTQLKPYKGIRQHRYHKETTEIAGMLNLLALPQNAADIATLCLAEEVDILARANAQFEQTYVGKEQEMYDRREQDRVVSAEVVTRLDTTFASICDVANACVLLMPSAVVNEFVDRVNVLIDAMERESTSQPTSTPTGEEGGGSATGGSGSEGTGSESTGGSGSEGSGDSGSEGTGTGDGTGGTEGGSTGGGGGTPPPPSGDDDEIVG